MTQAVHLASVRGKVLEAWITDSIAFTFLGIGGALASQIGAFAVQALVESRGFLAAARINDVVLHAHLDFDLIH
jgi:hypothetical protein